MSTRGRPTARGTSTWLRGYTYVPSMHAYRGPNGRTVARSTILEKLADSIEQREKSIIRHAEALANGQLGGAQYVSLEHLLLKRQGLQEAALAAGGWDRLTPADRGRVGAMLQHDIYPALARQAHDAALGQLSPAQAVNRAHMMMGTERAMGLQIEREHQPLPKEGSVRIARRHLDPAAKNCDDCLGFAGRGWQPEEELPVPGTDAICDGNCRCSIEYKDVLASEIDQWVGQQYG